MTETKEVRVPQDRRLSLRDLMMITGLLITITTNIVIVAWFAAKVDTTQTFTERVLNDVRNDVRAAAASVQQAIVAGAVQKAELDNLRERLTRLETRR